MKFGKKILSDQLDNTSISKTSQAGKDVAIRNVHFIPSDREIQNLDEFANTPKRSSCKSIFPNSLVLNHEY